jgi:hypothetical protein
VSAVKLWLLERDVPKEVEAYRPYDIYDAFLIRATTESDARVIARREAGSGNCWPDNPTHIKATEVKVSGKPGVVIASFEAG